MYFHHKFILGKDVDLMDIFLSETP